MKTKPDILYAVRNRFHTGGLLKPGSYPILNSPNILRRIILAPSLEEVIYLTYPNMHKEDWSELKLKVFAIQPERRHPIREPKFLAAHFGLKHAVEHNEFACFSNLRMESIGQIKIIKDSPLNENLVDESDNIYGKRYNLF